MKPAVIFDIDGTLVDSNDAHAQAWVDVLKEHGWDVPFERVRPLIGMGGDKVLPELTGIEKDSADGEAISSRRSEIFRDRFMPHLRPFPAVRELVLLLKQRGHPLAVASSATKDELLSLLGIAGIDDLVTQHTSSDDADASKPEPDIVAAALERLGRPDQAVMVGDTPYDVESAARAGIGSVAVRSGGWGNANLSGALAIYADVAELRDRYEESPLVRPGRKR